jgi:hypothetical protein
MTAHSTESCRLYITAMAPATMANIPPETRLAMPALVVGTADELGADELDEESVLVAVVEESLSVLVLVLLVEVEVEVVMVVMVMLSDMLMLVVVVGSVEVEVIAAEEVLGAALEEAAVAPSMVKRGRKL